MDHLRFSGKSEAEQRQELERYLRGEDTFMQVLTRLREMALPDWWVVSGVIYNNVWNHLTGRPFMTGVKDIDVFYYDDSDLSYEAEDVVIKRAEPLFADVAVPIEIRNQARVHLWYKGHFGHACAPITSCRDSIDGFSSKTHAVAVRLDAAGDMEIYAPYGLDDMYAFRIVPNRVNANCASYTSKGERALGVWPELTVDPW